MKALIALAAEGKHLTEAQAETAMSLMMNGDATPAQVAAFLMALRIKGETVEEITGCAPPHGACQGFYRWRFGQ